MEYSPKCTVALAALVVISMMSSVILMVVPESDFARSESADTFVMAFVVLEVLAGVPALWGIRR